MQKKLLAIAVAGALAPAAAMAQSTVEIYGRAKLRVDNWRATGGPADNFKSRMRVVDSGSRLGFRINESLGGGMRAFVVIESSAAIDSSNGNGLSAAERIVQAPEGYAPGNLPPLLQIVTTETFPQVRPTEVAAAIAEAHRPTHGASLNQTV